jgi:hypothetical protein
LEKIHNSNSSCVVSDDRDVELLFNFLSSFIPFGEEGNSEFSFNNQTIDGEKNDGKSNSKRPQPIHLSKYSSNLFGLNKLVSNFNKNKNKSSKNGTAINFPKTVSVQNTSLLLEESKDCVQIVIYNEKLILLLHHYSSILTFFKERGAYVDVLKPEFFLSYEDFLLFSSICVTTSGCVYPPVDYNNIFLYFKNDVHFKNCFKIISCNSWNFLFFQIFKLFFLSKITVKKFLEISGINSISTTSVATNSNNSPKKFARDVRRSSSGKSGKVDLSKNPVDKNISPDIFILHKSLLSMGQSNFYSTAELLLLRWLSFHFNKYFSSTVRNWKIIPIHNFDSNLSDGLVLIGLIKNHTPFLKIDYIENPTSYSEKLKNCCSVLSALKELGFDCFILEKDILDPDPRIMVLFIYSLFLFLPYFLSSGNDCSIIQIPAKANLQSSKPIYVSNPGKKPIMYNIRLEGSKEFSCSTNTISVGPSSESLISINVKPKFSKEVTAQLLFIPKSTPGLFVSPLSYVLKTTVLPPEPVDQLYVTGYLYSVTQTSIIIKNPFEKNCLLTAKIIPLNSDTISLSNLKNLNSDKSLKFSNEINFKSCIDYVPFSINVINRPISVGESSTIPVCFYFLFFFIVIIEDFLLPYFSWMSQLFNLLL